MNQQLEDYHALLKEILAANVKPIDLEGLEAAKSLAEMGYGVETLHEIINILGLPKAKPITINPQTFAEKIEAAMNRNKSSD